LEVEFDRWAKEQAKKVTCVNNLRQMHVGFVSYDGDYDGWFPATRGVDDTASSVTYKMEWMMQVIFFSEIFKKKKEERTSIRKQVF